MEGARSSLSVQYFQYFEWRIGSNIQSSQAIKEALKQLHGPHFFNCMRDAKKLKEWLNRGFQVCYSKCFLGIP